MPDPISKPIAFTMPDGLVTHHTTHLLCQQLPGRYLLSFFECLPPLIVGNTDAEKQQELDKLTEIPATCVARFVVAEADIEAFIGVLQNTVAQARQQAQVGGYRAFA